MLVLNEEIIKNIFCNHNFIEKNANVHVIEYVNAVNDITVYLLPTKSIKVVLDPSVLSKINLSDYDTKIYHNSNMNRFPKRDNGHGLIFYGIQISLQSSMELEALLNSLA